MGMGMCIMLPSPTDVVKKETWGGVCFYDSLVCLYHRRPYRQHKPTGGSYGIRRGDSTVDDAVSNTVGCCKPS